MKRLHRPIERCLYDSNDGSGALDRVILVGGATRMPMIRQLVARTFRKLPQISIDPDLAVALGAAVQAGLVAEDRALEDVILTDVSPFSVGVATGTRLPNGKLLSGFFAPIIERNTSLPASREEIFYTIGDNQTRLDVAVYQGEAPMVEDNLFLGRFDLVVPKAPAGNEGIAIRITYDTSGLIEVEGRALSTGKTAGTVIRENVHDLGEKEIEARRKAMAELKLHPREQEENAAVLARIKRIYEMTTGEDRFEIQHILMSFEAALADQDSAVIDKMRGAVSQILDRIDDHYVS